VNELALVQKVRNYAHILHDQGVPYQAYIAQISYLLFLKMDDGRAGLVASGLIKDDALDDPDLLPPPDEIIENLEAALDRFRNVALSPQST
jgi:hypothetical protein